MLRITALILRLRIALGYVPNLQWFRASLSRQIVLDHARAHAAIAEIERCLNVRQNGGRCERLNVTR